MIRFGPPENSSEVLTEDSKVRDNALRAMDVDVDSIRSTYRDFKDEDKSTGVLDVAQAVDKHGVRSVANLTDKISDKMRGQTVDTRSLIAKARNSVLQFPLYVTQGIPVASAHIIGGYFERVYATLVQSVLSQNPIINEEDINQMKFLKQFHTNLREAAERIHNEYYEPIDESDRMMQEAVFHSVQLSSDIWLEFRVIPCIDETLIAENARLMNDPLAGFEILLENPTQISRKMITDTPVQDTPETFLNDEYLTRIVDAIKDDATKNNKAPIVTTVDELKQHIRSGTHPPVKWGGDVIRSRPSKDGTGTDFYIQAKRGGKTVEEIMTSPREPREAVKAPILLRDTDIKKINGMLPYTIEASFRVKLQDGSMDRDVRFVIGVKSVMHLISIKDLAGDLQELIMGNVKNLQKVRYKTGEISRKDYLFNPKGLKADAAKHIHHNKRWMNTLKRLGEYEKMHGTLLKKSVQAMAGGQVPIPNGTLILSQPDVTKLINETGIDLSEVGQAKRLAKSLFLIAVVIVDTTAETMRVLFTDSDVDWDVLSLSSLDAELAKTDNSALMRELSKTVNR